MTLHFCNVLLLSISLLSTGCIQDSSKDLNRAGAAGGMVRIGGMASIGGTAGTGGMSGTDDMSGTGGRASIGGMESSSAIDGAEAGMCRSFRHRIWAHT